MNGEQFSDEFATIHTLQRVPAINDKGLQVVESPAILDYPEAKHPTPALALMPNKPEAIAAALPDIRAILERRS